MKTIVVCTDEMFAAIYPTEPGTATADGYPGHYCAALDCWFRLHHHILTPSGERVRLSTVGHLMVDDDPRIIGFSEDSYFETAVFDEFVSENGYLEMETRPRLMLHTPTSVEAQALHNRLLTKILAGGDIDTIGVDERERHD